MIVHVEHRVHGSYVVVPGLPCARVTLRVCLRRCWPGSVLCVSIALYVGSRFRAVPCTVTRRNEIQLSIDFYRAFIAVTGILYEQFPVTTTLVLTCDATVICN